MKGLKFFGRKSTALNLEMNIFNDKFISSSLKYTHLMMKVKFHCKRPKILAVLLSMYMNTSSNKSTSSSLKIHIEHFYINLIESI